MHDFIHLALPQFLQFLLIGLTIGAMYALIALGYTMVYGILELINFAHGEVFMIGAMVGWLALEGLGKANALASLPWPLTLALVMAVAMGSCALIGVAIERVAYRPLLSRKAPRLALLITALGLSILLQNVVQLFTQAREKTYATFLPETVFTLPLWGEASLSLSVLEALVIGISFALMIGLTLLVRFTTLGKAMRATAQDMEAAGLMGIEPRRIIQITFAIGSALGGAAGVLFGMMYNASHTMGYLAGLKAFTAAVLGGIGNLPGAMLGGLLLGVLESLGAGYVSAQWKDAFAFGVLILVLLFRPAGLLGENVPEKV